MRRHATQLGIQQQVGLQLGVARRNASMGQDAQGHAAQGFDIDIWQDVIL
jgi:hypothetical protein